MPAAKNRWPNVPQKVLADRVMYWLKYYLHDEQQHRRIHKCLYQLDSERLVPLWQESGERSHTDQVLVG